MIKIKALYHKAVNTHVVYEFKDVQLAQQFTRYCNEYKIRWVRVR
jgi:hypothetical protein